jgi:hypothetical protein
MLFYIKLIDNLLFTLEIPQMNAITAIDSLCR